MPVVTITIRDVARRAGVSVPAASVVLSGASTGTTAVGAAARARIRLAAQELGYRPNLAGRGVRQGRSFLYGVLVDATNTHLLPAFMRGAQEAMAAHSCAPLFFTHRSRDEEVRNLELCRARQVDGLIVNVTPGTGLQAPGRRYAEWRRQRPVVELFGHFLKDAPTVCLDMAAAGRMAVERLAALGHRRILLLTHERYDTARRGGSLFFDAWEHACGYTAVMTERGLAPRIARITLVPDMADDVWAARAVAALAPFLHAPARRRPTAVVCYNDWVACGALRAAAAAGLRVPHDLSVAGLNNLPMCMALQPALTSITFPGEALGGRAADLVMPPATAADSALPPSLPPPTWIDRASVAHAPPCH
jgi:LacI family transcriptional regulator